MTLCKLDGTEKNNCYGKCKFTGVQENCLIDQWIVEWKAYIRRDKYKENSCKCCEVHLCQKCGSPRLTHWQSAYGTDLTECTGCHSKFRHKFKKEIPKELRAFL